MDLAYNRNAQIRRRLLEDFPDAQATSAAKPFVNYRSLRSASFHSPEYVLTQLEILEHEGRVVLKKLPADPAECMVNLTPLGWKSLETSEDVWLRRVEATLPATNTTHNEFHHSTVGNFTSMSGSPGAKVTQTNVSNDLQGVFSAIDRLVEAIKVSPSLKAETKQDAEIEADQLRGELKKSKPSPTFITKVLDSFKALDTAATVLPHVMDLVDKLKGYLPGVL